ncbi:MAG: hypothetical protein M0008_01810 [Actinomycetota bacterium]|nr:hypothetical protein [Actinomycetota bacterium]
MKKEAIQRFKEKGLGNLRVGNTAVLLSVLALIIAAVVGLLVSFTGSKAVPAKGHIGAAANSSEISPALQKKYLEAGGIPGCPLPPEMFIGGGKGWRYREACKSIKDGLVTLPKMPSMSAKQPPAPKYSRAQLRQQTGILPPHDGLNNGPAGNYGVTFVSGWESEYWGAGYQYSVRAGYVRNDPAQGVLRWQQESMAKDSQGYWLPVGAGTGPAGFVYTPTKVGALRVVSFIADTVSLVSTNGSRFVFNLITHALTPQ